MTASKKLLLVATALAINAFSIELYASQNSYERKAAVNRALQSKSDTFKVLFGASYFTLSAGAYVIPVAISKYRLGKKLANPACTLTPQSIKNRGLVGIAVGTAAMLPFGVLAFQIGSEVNQELAKKLAEEKKLASNLTEIEEIGEDTQKSIAAELAESNKQILASQENKETEGQEA